jgi:AraC family ethanolamine operon transcriptional activator
MSILDVAAPAARAVRRFTEPDDFSAALVGGEFEYLPLPGERFEATLRQLRVGDLMVQHADDGPHLSRAAFLPGLAGLVMPLGIEVQRPEVNGVAVAATTVFLSPGAREFTVACRVAQRWAALSMPESLLAEIAEAAPAALRRPDHQTLVTAPVGARRLAGALEAAGRMAEAPQDALRDPEAATGLARSLRDLAAAVLVSGEAALPTPRATRQAQRLVRRAEEFLDANLTRPVYLEELATVLGVSQRSLNGAFRACFGIPPHAYLKTRRLALVRRALRDAQGGAELVKSVALGHGFWHLGHFSHDYKAMFGELPSATLAARPRRRATG